MRIHNCHPVATLKEITPCLSVSYSLYELPTTGLACRVFGISWPPFGLRCDCGRRRVGRMEEPATRWPPTKNPEEPKILIGHNQVFDRRLQKAIPTTGPASQNVGKLTQPSQGPFPAEKRGMRNVGCSLGSYYDTVPQRGQFCLLQLRYLFAWLWCTLAKSTSHNRPGIARSYSHFCRVSLPSGSRPTYTKVLSASLLEQCSDARWQ